jgi:ubiquinone/menaquinone biosynthesis C-methylase UbiE
VNYWDNLLGDDDHAASYMMTYGEGPGCDTRHVLSNFINVHETVLDVGCGPGWNMDHFAEYGPMLERYKGVDYSERFVRVANQRRKQLDTPTSYAMPFELQDCRELKEPDNSWDVVLLQDCVEHTNGYEKPLQEALRVARKRVIVAFWHLLEDQDEDGSKNDDGNDGYGYWYSRTKWEHYLDKLDVSWFHHRIKDNKNRDFYIIDKDVL